MWGRDDFTGHAGVLTAILQAHPLCGRVTIVETREFSTDQFYFKTRADLLRGYRLQVRIYSNFDHVDYAYQFFKKGTPILRWDNKEEFRTLITYPHHHHGNQGNVLPSPLTGNHQEDIVFMLREIEKFLNDHP